MPGIGRKTKYIFIIYHNITSSKYFQYFIRLFKKVHWKAGKQEKWAEERYLGIYIFTHLYIHIHTSVNKQEAVIVMMIVMSPEL